MILPVTFSSTAVAEIKKILAVKGIDNHQLGLRVAIKGAGCSGTSFILGFDSKTENDVEFLMDEFKIFIEKKHFLYLVGMEIDFIDDNYTRGFTFNSKNNI